MYWSFSRQNVKISPSSVPRGAGLCPVTHDTFFFSVGYAVLSCGSGCCLCIGVRVYKGNKISKESYDMDRMRPVIKCSICTGEQVAGFLDKETGKFEDIMLIMNEKDLEKFVSTYDIKEKIEKIY